MRIFVLTSSDYEKTTIVSVHETLEGATRAAVPMVEHQKLERVEVPPTELPIWERFGGGTCTTLAIEEHDVVA